MSDKQNITPQTRQNLIHINKLNIQATSELLIKLRAHITSLNDNKKSRQESNLDESADETNLRILTEYNILLKLISLDLNAAYLTYLKANEPYEVQYATKHLIIILREGFKKIYNYVWTDNKGVLKTDDRNNSIWKKDINHLVNNELNEMKDEYLRLTNELDIFDDEILAGMRSPRNMFVHYDDEPSKAYDEMMSIDIELISQKVIPFFKIIQQMLSFSYSLYESYIILLPKKTDAMFEEHFQILENMKLSNSENPQTLKIIDERLKNLNRIHEEYIKSIENQLN